MPVELTHVSKDGKLLHGFGGKEMGLRGRPFNTHIKIKMVGLTFFTQTRAIPRHQIELK